MHKDFRKKFFSMSMKKYFSNAFFPIVILFFVIFSFFASKLIVGKIPIPADAILGLYHPFRDITVDGFAPGKFPIKNPLITDPVIQTYPWRTLVVDNIKNLNLPLWNPYSFSGQPLLANIQSAPFTIFNVFFLLFGQNVAWMLQIITTTILAGVFMFLYLREIKLSKEAALFGSLTLPFSGFFVASMTWGTVITCAMYLPLILFLLEKISKKISLTYFLLLIFVTSQIIFSGHPQTALYIFGVSILYALFKYVATKNIKFLIVSLSCIVLGFLIASPQLLPTIEFIKLSARNLDQAYTNGRLDWFIPPQNLVQLVAPDYFGNPTTANYWGIWNYTEFVSFMGIIPLGMVVLSFFKKNEYKNFFVGLLIFSLLLGLANPISKIPFVFNIPFLSTLQPSRIIFLIDFSLCVLASFGLEFFLESKRKKQIIFAVCFLLTTTTAIAAFTYLNKDIFAQITLLDARSIALRNLVIPSVFVAIFVIICALKVANFPKVVIVLVVFAATIVELFRFGYKFTPFSKASWIFPDTKITQYLQQVPKPFRIMSTDRRIMHPNISSVYKIETIEGYDPLYLKDYAQYISVMQSNNPATEVSSFNRILTPQVLSSKLVDLANTKYVLSFDEISTPQFEKVLEEGETKVYLNKNALPRAFFVEDVIPTTNKQEEYAFLLRPDFDLSTKATAQEYSYVTQPSYATAQISTYTDSTIIIETESARFKPLVVTNINYPGWQAKIDGKASKIFTANAIFQLVEVPSGKHTVEFKFRPKSFYNGLYASAAGIIVAVGSAILIWRKKFQ